MSSGDDGTMQAIQALAAISEMHKHMEGLCRLVAISKHGLSKARSAGQRGLQALAVAERAIAKARATETLSEGLEALTEAENAKNTALLSFAELADITTSVSGAIEEAEQVLEKAPEIAGKAFKLYSALPKSTMSQVPCIQGALQVSSLSSLEIDSNNFPPRAQFCTTFPKFLQLPVELRRMIWEFTLPPPKVFEAVFDKDKGHFDFQEHRKPPSMRSSCFEAWQVSKDNGYFEINQVWFSPRRDVVYFENTEDGDGNTIPMVSHFPNVQRMAFYVDAFPEGMEELEPLLNLRTIHFIYHFRSPA